MVVIFYLWSFLLQQLIIKSNSNNVVHLDLLEDKRIGTSDDYFPGYANCQGNKHDFPATVNYPSFKIKDEGGSCLCSQWSSHYVRLAPSVPVFKPRLKTPFLPGI